MSLLFKTKFSPQLYVAVIVEFAKKIRFWFLIVCKVKNNDCCAWYVLEWYIAIPSHEKLIYFTPSYNQIFNIKIPYKYKQNPNQKNEKSQSQINERVYNDDIPTYKNKPKRI